MARVTGVAGVSGEIIKIVIAPDSFKGNLSAYPMTRAQAIKKSSKLIPDVSENLMRLIQGQTY